MNDNFVNKVITVGTPYLGSDMANASLLTSKIFGTSASEFAESINLPRLDSSSIVDLSTDGEVLRGLHYADELTKYSALYGDIRASIQLKIFNLNLSRSTSLGDGVVSSKSATYLSDKIKPRAFGFTQEIYTNLVIIPGVAPYYATISDNNDILNLKYYHANLMKDASVMARVIKQLQE